VWRDGVPMTDYAQIPVLGGGTLIETELGHIPIDWLVAGDKVRTRDHGFQPLLWIGRARFAGQLRVDPDGLEFGRPDAVVDMSAGVDVMLSGAQAELHFGEPEVLTAVGDLHGWSGISRVRSELTFYGLLFAKQELFRANGMWVGSMRSTKGVAPAFVARDARLLRRACRGIERRAARLCVLADEIDALRPRRKKWRRAAA